MIDINRLEKYRENNRIEAKKAIGGLPHSLWETYSAFANTLGGIILLGVEELEDRSLHPIELPYPDELVDEFWELINSDQKVSRNILTKDDVTVQESGGRRIVVISVPRAHRIDRPIYIDNDLYGGTYRRNGEGDYRCTHDEIDAMLRDASERAADMQVLDLMDTSVFDENSISSYRIRCEYEGSCPETASLDDIGFLKEIGAVGTDDSGVLHPTAAGLLMFGYEYEIVRQFPLYHLEYKEENDNGTCFVISSDSGDWSGNVYDFFQKVTSRLMEDMRFVTDGSYEKNIRSAVREALSNCLINADYYGSHGLQVIRRSSGIVLSNPGGLRVELDRAKVRGISDPRNKGLINMFRLMGAGKGTGGGLRDIYSVWQIGGLEEPILTEEFGADRTTLSLPVRSRTERVRINDLQREMIAEYLTDNITADEKQLSELLGGDIKRTTQLIRQLQWEKLIIAEEHNGSFVYRLRHEHK